MDGFLAGACKRALRLAGASVRLPNARWLCVVPGLPQLVVCMAGEELGALLGAVRDALCVAPRCTQHGWGWPVHACGRQAAVYRHQQACLACLSVCKLVARAPLAAVCAHRLMPWCCVRKYHPNGSQPAAGAQQPCTGSRPRLARMRSKHSPRSTHAGVSFACRFAVTHQARMRA